MGIGRRNFLLGAGGLVALAAAADALPMDLLPQDVLPTFATGLPNGAFDNLAPQAPVVEPIDYPFEVLREGHVCEAFARISMRAVVLARRRYWFGPLTISPVDMVLGWGPMSNPVVLRTVRIRLAGRDYEWEVRPPPRIRGQEVGEYSGAIHAIPASLQVRDSILSTRRNHVVRISGHLCNVRTPDGGVFDAVRGSQAGGERKFVLVDEIQRLQGAEI